jgi:carbon-monoxide dehydrogenase medium subunit
MARARFQYHAPRSLDEALALRARYGFDGLVLAGGQSLMPLLNLRLVRPAALIDVNRVPGLDDIRVAGRDWRTGALALEQDDGQPQRNRPTQGGVRIGALARYHALRKDPALRRSAPLVVEAIPWIGHAQVLSRGTIGGSLAHADPSAELPCVALALDAAIEARSEAGTRLVAAADFFVDYYTTALQPDELLTAVHLPRLAAGAGWAFVEMCHRPGDFAVVAVAAVVALDGAGVCAQARLALAAVAATPVRLGPVEAMLVGHEPGEEIWSAAAAMAAGSVEPDSDVRAPAAYRRHLVGVLVRRALRTATERARTGGAGIWHDRQ